MHIRPEDAQVGVNTVEQLGRKGVTGAPCIKVVRWSAHALNPLLLVVLSSFFTSFQVFHVSSYLEKREGKR